MTLYKRNDSPNRWVKFAPIKGEVRPVFESTGTSRKRDAQKYHDKLQAERWEQDKLGVRPRYTWDDAAAKFLAETSYKCTHEWDKSMLRWFHPFLGGRKVSGEHSENARTPYHTCQVRRVGSPTLSQSLIDQHCGYLQLEGQHLLSDTVPICCPLWPAEYGGSQPSMN
jgi:hypothetical protein